MNITDTMQSLGITTFDLYPTFDEYVLAVENEQLCSGGDDLTDGDMRIVADAYERGLTPEQCVWIELLARYEPDLMQFDA